MGEALIDLVQQYPALWDKQDIMYKDSSYKRGKMEGNCRNFTSQQGRGHKEMEVFEGYLC